MEKHTALLLSKNHSSASQMESEPPGFFFIVMDNNLSDFVDHPRMGHMELNETENPKIALYASLYSLMP